MIAWLVICWHDLVQVVNTGMCPAAPTDIPPYPCSLSDYVLRMTVGPWGLLSNITIFGGWLVILAVFTAVRAIIKAVARRQKLDSKR